MEPIFSFKIIYIVFNHWIIHKIHRIGLLLFSGDQLLLRKVRILIFIILKFFKFINFFFDYKIDIIVKK
jgi:hypothetical protein